MTPVTPNAPGLGMLNMMTLMDLLERTPMPSQEHLFNPYERYGDQPGIYNYGPDEPQPSDPTGAPRAAGRTYSPAHNDVKSLRGRAVDRDFIQPRRTPGFSIREPFEPDEYLAEEIGSEAFEAYTRMTPLQRLLWLNDPANGFVPPNTQYQQVPADVSLLDLLSRMGGAQ
ncbi:hypothetical protein [Mameliella alba]|uniref:Uncharacterized protein n=1 Tax=Mameliella alba TaxID=561184 RepID=A0A0B3SKN3_9RHOB|nr:hypothetical protein [Mameliella alba]KHQ51109.1 hypothetical protein OA50_04480 [Mameliella alba]